MALKSNEFLRSFIPMGLAALVFSTIVIAVLLFAGWNPLSKTKWVLRCPEGMSLVVPRGSNSICVVGVEPTQVEVPK